MNLNPETIGAYKELLLNPSKHKLDFKPITECFEKSDDVTAKHILAKEFIDYLNKPLPKVILYIVMNQVFGQCDGKDSSGNLGYHLKFKADTGG
ncbi:hypothetical protein LCGC14_0989600 [marine sediment metagenome]|uniref:Uncharacterized protein n=1 Tax=marine sediment metagenome TaxID=412755 RepID=A0A0F9N629_9ZZZZ